ncbi:MAG: spermidine synthase, partial [Terriglobales bacterium]
MALFAVLSWPVDFGAERVYSPYQLIERVVGPDYVNMLLAGGSFYLTICDFRPAAVAAYPGRLPLEKYYNLPFKLVPNAERVAIVGAGSGNDVAAALRGNAQHVEAIEIDPVIQKFGQIFHPEQPFSDKRVHAVINDARAFLRTTKDKFDLIVFSIIDSHTLATNAASLRLDSYVYTTQSMKDARADLKDNGLLCLSFCAMNPQIAKKIYLMMYDAFDHHPPVCIRNTSYTFIQSKNGDFKLPADMLDTKFYEDVRPMLEDPNLKAEASTDDWPFLYMPKRIYPFSYFPMFGLVLLLSAGMIRSLHAVNVTRSSMPFFFLGAGFMLIETKAITELGLNFGNTWYVIAITIAAIMI